MQHSVRAPQFLTFVAEVQQEVLFHTACVFYGSEALGGRERSYDSMISACLLLFPAWQRPGPHAPQFRRAAARWRYNCGMPRRTRGRASRLRRRSCCLLPLLDVPCLLLCPADSPDSNLFSRGRDEECIFADFWTWDKTSFYSHLRQKFCHPSSADKMWSFKQCFRAAIFNVYQFPRQQSGALIAVCFIAARATFNVIKVIFKQYRAFSSEEQSDLMGIWKRKKSRGTTNDYQSFLHCRAMLTWSLLKSDSLLMNCSCCHTFSPVFFLCINL